MKLLLFTVIVCITITIQGQEKYFSSAEIKKDIDSLVSYLEQTHPNPYTVVSKADFYKKIELTKKSLPDSLNVITFFSKIAPILSSLNDGHTAAVFPYVQWTKSNPYCFPISIKIKKDRSLVVDEEQAYIPLHSKILSINQVESKEIIKTLISSHSGEDVNFRIPHINRTLRERYGAHYGFKENYNVKYEHEGIVKSLNLKGLRIAKDIRDEVRKTSASTMVELPFSYTLLEDSVGYLDSRSFFGTYREKFASFLDSTFTLIKKQKIKNLIIDIRNNGGGDSKLADDLFQYISKVPFQQLGKSIAKYSQIRKRFYDYYRKAGGFGKISDSVFEKKYFAHKNGSLVVEEDSHLIPLRENPLRFKGNVFLLTSVKTFSAGADFAWTFKYFNMGSIIGETTGGQIVSFGDLVIATLPISRLSLTISHKEFYLYGATEKERHGVIPHYKVSSEKALDYALKLIKNKE